ncbi:hypothetical protein Q1695_013589 [Nippostrongylus brasiliensis]|nr:hypothetical protein Q1695_013589 [Nippostrongylus brasiliensis]
MKGGGIGRPPPDAGIPSDMKTLYEAFRERKSFRLLEFYKVAENYGLKNIFAGRMSVAELVGFEENLLKAAFAYIRPRKEYPNGIGEERSLLERIFGVYVTFVIFYAQPLDYVTKIHITPVDRCDLMFFLWNVLIPGYHVDACSCIQRLFVDAAFRTVVSVKNHDLTNHKRYEKPNIVDVLVDEKERYNPIEITKEVMENPAMKETRLEKRDVIYVFKTHDSRLYSTLAYEIDKLDDALDESSLNKAISDVLDTSTNLTYTGAAMKPKRLPGRTTKKIAASNNTGSLPLLTLVSLPP